MDPVDPDPDSDPDSQHCDYQVIQIYDRRIVPLCQAGRSSPVSNSGSDSAPPPELYSTSIHTPRYSSLHCISGGYKEMSSIFADQKRPRIRVPMRGDRGGCGVSANGTVVHIT